MSDDQQQPAEEAPQVEREERRLQRLRLVWQLSTVAERFDDDPDPREAA